MKGDFRRFTSEEKALIREKYPSIGGIGLAPILNRTRESISIVARGMGVKRERWTAERVAELIRRYPIEGASPELCATLGYKSGGPLNCQATRLGLKYEGPHKRKVGRDSPKFLGFISPAGRNYDVPATVMAEVRAGSVRGTRLLEVSIDEKYLSEILQRQHGRCYFTGDPISFMDRTASVDRIDSEKGYVNGNIHITTNMSNIIKRNGSDDSVIAWCRKVVAFQETLSAKLQQAA